MIRAYKRISTICNRNINPLSLLTRMPLLNRMQYYAFSNKANDKIWQLSDEEQKCIISYYTIRYLLTVDEQQLLRSTKSIRQRIFMRDHLIHLVKKAAEIEEKFIVTINEQKKNKSKEQNDKNNAPFSNLSEAGFTQENIDEVLKAFDLNRGARINELVYSQARFANAMVNGLLVLFPSSGSGLILKKIIQSGSHKRFITFGEKGSGKSFSYFLYDYLSNFIVQFRIKISKNQVTPTKRFLQFIPDNELIEIKKLFYVPFKKLDAYSTLINITSFQCQYIKNPFLNIDMEGTNEQHKHNAINYLNKIQVFYSSHRIKTVYIIDQTNEYLSKFRQMIANSSQSYTLSLKSDLVLSSSLLALLQDRFNLVIYNSSQSIEAQLIERWNRAKSTQQYYDLFNHNQNKDPSLISLHIQFCQLFSKRSGHLYYYELFWQQLCVYLQILRLPMYKYIRELFNQTFGISPDFAIGDNKTADNFKWWRYDVKFLHINDSCRKEKQLAQIKKAILNGDVKTIRKIFKQLQSFAQFVRLQQLKRIYASYYSKGETPIIRLFRYQILLLIQSAASDEEISKKSNTFISVQLDPLLQKYTVKFRDQKQALDRQVQHFTEYFGTGYNTSKTQIKLLLGEESLEDINKILENDFSKIKAFIDESFYHSALSHKVAATIFDMLQFQLFKLGPEELKINYIFANKQNQISYQQKTYKLKNVKPFQGKRHARNTKLQISLDYILKQAAKFQKEIILGYPVKSRSNSLTKKNQAINKLQLSIQDSALFHFSDNAIFDFVLVNYNKQKNHFSIKTFDTTVGSVQSKVRKTKVRVLQRQLRRISKSHKKIIQWEHIIFAREKRVNEWIMTNKEGQIQLMYLNQSIRDVYRNYPLRQKVGTLKLKISAFNTSQASESMFILPTANKQIGENIWKTIKDISSYMNEKLDDVKEDDGSLQTSDHIEESNKDDLIEQSIQNYFQQIERVKQSIYAEKSNKQLHNQKWLLTLKNIDLNAINEPIKSIIQNFINEEIIKAPSNLQTKKIVRKQTPKKQK